MFSLYVLHLEYLKSLTIHEHDTTRTLSKDECIRYTNNYARYTGLFHFNERFLIERYDFHCSRNCLNDTCVRYDKTIKKIYSATSIYRIWGETRKLWYIEEFDILSFDLSRWFRFYFDIWRFTTTYEIICLIQIVGKYNIIL